MRVAHEQERRSGGVHQIAPIRGYLERKLRRCHRARQRHSEDSSRESPHCPAQYRIDVSSVTHRPSRTTESADSSTPLWSLGPKTTL